MTERKVWTCGPCDVYTNIPDAAQDDQAIHLTILRPFPWAYSEVEQQQLPLMEQDLCRCWICCKSKCNMNWGSHRGYESRAIKMLYRCCGRDGLDVSLHYKQGSIPKICLLSSKIMQLYMLVTHNIQDHTTVHVSYTQQATTSYTEKEHRPQ